MWRDSAPVADCAHGSEGPRHSDGSCRGGRWFVRPNAMRLSRDEKARPIDERSRHQLKPRVRRSARLVWNLRLDKLRQKSERFLPAEIASIRGNDIGDAFLHDVYLCPTEYFLQGNRRLHFSGQVRIVEFTCVTIRSWVASSRYVPPKEWLRPVVKLVNDILYVPPTLASYGEP